MTDPLPGSYRELVVNRQNELEALIENGGFRPFFLHSFVIFACVPLLSLAIPCQRPGVSRLIRSVGMAVVLAIALETIVYRRAFLGAGGYMVGLAVTWWIVWCATLLVFNDAAKDFRRIERRAGSVDIPIKPKLNGGNGGILHQRCPNGKYRVSDHSDSLGQETLVWQSYPKPLSHRLNWIMGLIFNMRGPEWNWRISTLEPLPPAVRMQLDKSSMDRSDMSPEHKDLRYPDSKTQIKSAFFIFFKSYIAIDILKVVMMRDAYFWGAERPPVPPFPFNLLAPFPILVYSYRLIMSVTGVFFALLYVTSLNPIIFLGLSLAFPRAARGLTSTPLNSPWMYSSLFGPLLTSILEKGLAGCWAQWWHQLFRFGFLSASRWLLSVLPSSIAKPAYTRRSVHALIAFSLSGALHAVGSFTQHASTRPLHGPFLFFFLQAPGVMIQHLCDQVLLPFIFPKGVPRAVQRTFNLCSVVSWFLLTGGLIADDFARGGLWLVEPLPFSPLRGLGFGAEGEGWLCWREPWFRMDGGGKIRVL
ncbi:hypothetical protein ASPZODRAFT_59887 [Penicilliopsis zonata CBS 506.65]|uniref:Wax synthase domain-containing protein n=1 Tax=Penicilliopsis zonata CBS 506.65 TaxID=1073090 RepID=A0A1L9SNP3_9EURO|nr:hypothetical protein ASPZODRAFT_59887 [Penicilliopsis zonata CBS 506.65]OJJ48872.1 hypothetical protein ASPZODRAFT_59887 [Penicilliopsis zonata CBS 506.65]